MVSRDNYLILTEFSEMDIVACQKNTYKSGSNSQKVCNSCPAHSHTVSTGSSDHRKCLCDVGYKGPAGGPCSGIVTCSK